MTRVEKFLAAAVTLTPILYLIGSAWYWSAAIRPEGVHTVVEHFKRFGEPRRASRLQRDGTNYYELSGIHVAAPVLVFPSAPPAYIYDSAGQLVDWCPDPGDMPGYPDRWRSATREALSISAIRERFGL